MAKIRKADAIARLEHARDQIPSLEYGYDPRLDQEPPQLPPWRRQTDSVLRAIFGENSRHAREFNDIRYTLGKAAAPQALPQDRLSHFRDSLDTVRRLFYSMIEEVTSWEDEPDQDMEQPSPSAGPIYVDPTRLDELRAIKSPDFDLTRLIRLCEELNKCYANDCFLATAMLVRAIMDHVPPLFGVKTFQEVANYPQGSRSFRESMQHLMSSRKIADAHLHTHIRKRETLPNRTQVNFSNNLDVLLEEVVRIVPR